MEARGDASIFKTKGTILLGATKHLTGAKKTNLYMLARLPEGVKLAEVPMLQSIPGATELPVLAKGARVEYSTFSGAVVDLNVDFLKEDLMKAALKLGGQYLPPSLMEYLPLGEQQDMKQAAAEAVRQTQTALRAVTMAEATKTKAVLLQEAPRLAPSWTSPSPNHNAVMRC